MAFFGFRHIGLKVLSLVLAALIWLLVSGEQIVERALRIPLEFTNLPAQLELVGEPPTVVDVRVRGSSGALSRVATGELVAVLDLRTARAGQRLFHLTGADVRAPFFRYFERAQSTDETIEELVVTATNLASRKIGAIIVIERQIGLRNYIESGIPLDAMVTYDLMASIFLPGSPLHDGAAIIQGDRVAAAACFLPLSVNPKVSRELGTRHRAAIGLTEENDAVAVVVSEETGSVSLVLGGDLQRGIAPDALRTELRSLISRRRRMRLSRAVARTSVN